MALFNFSKKQNQTGVLNKDLESFLADYSIEVMPRTAQKFEDFREILPQSRIGKKELLLLPHYYFMLGLTRRLKM